MREMECVHLDGKQDKYLIELLKVINVIPKFISWDDLKITNNAPLLVIVDEAHIETLIEIVKLRDLKLIVGLNARRDFKLVSRFSDYFDKIFGFIDMSQEINYNTPILKNYINMNFSAHAISLEKLANDLGNIQEFTKSELKRVKDLHDRLVKVRVDNLKGFTITSKFMAGEKSGGEFFEMIQTNQQFYFIQAGSDSYILSSLILNEMAELKNSLESKRDENQIENFEKMIKHHASESGSNLNYCIIKIDTKTLLAECTFQGNGYLYFQNELIDFSKPVKLKLKSSDKLFVISNGALQNLIELNPKLSVRNFYKENNDMAIRDLINEFFFELSRNKTGSFLNYDALVTAVEVESKALYQL